MSYNIISGVLGTQAISDTSTTQQHPLGFEQIARDATYGVGTFIYAKGVASTAVGSWVLINEDDWTTSLATTGDIGRIAVSMSANVAGQYGWYQIAGKAIGKALTGYVDNAAVYLTGTAGSVDDAVISGNLVAQAKGASAVGTPSSGLAEFELDRPYVGAAPQGAVADLTDSSGGAAADGTIGVVTLPTALTDNGGGTADGTVASQAAPVTLTDSTGYDATHDDTVAAVAAITTLTDSTGQSGTHDDTLAATTLPTTLTDSTGLSASHNDTVADGQRADGTMGGIADGSFETVGDTSTGDRSGAIMNNFKECQAALVILTQNDSDLSQKIIEHNTLIGVMMQNASDTGQKVIELVTRDAVHAQNTSDLTQKVIELVTLAGTAQNNLKELTARQAENLTAITACRDGLKELATKVNAALAALRNAGVLAV